MLSTDKRLLWISRGRKPFEVNVKNYCQLQRCWYSWCSVAGTSKDFLLHVINEPWYRVYLLLSSELVVFSGLLRSPKLRKPLSGSLVFKIDSSGVVSHSNLDALNVLHTKAGSVRKIRRSSNYCLIIDVHRSFSRLTLSESSLLSLLRAQSTEHRAQSTDSKDREHSAKKHKTVKIWFFDFSIPIFSIFSIPDRSQIWIFRKK